MLVALVALSSGRAAAMIVPAKPPRARGSSRGVSLAEGMGVSFLACDVWSLVAGLVALALALAGVAVAIPFAKTCLFGFLLFASCEALLRAFRPSPRDDARVMADLKEAVRGRFHRRRRSRTKRAPQ